MPKHHTTVTLTFDAFPGGQGCLHGLVVNQEKQNQAEQAGGKADHCGERLAQILAQRQIDAGLGCQENAAYGHGHPCRRHTSRGGHAASIALSLHYCKITSGYQSWFTVELWPAQRLTVWPLHVWRAAPQPAAASESTANAELRHQCRSHLYMLLAMRFQFASELLVSCNVAAGPLGNARCSSSSAVQVVFTY